MKRRRVVLFSAIGVVLLAGGGLFATGFGRPKEKKDDGPRIEAVRRGPFLVKIRETGILEPLYKVSVKSNVDGEIKKLFVREGDEVAAGQSLIQLDDKQIREEKNQSDANLRSAKAQWEQAKRNVGLTEIRQDSGLVEAQDNERIARAALDVANKTTAQQITTADLEIASTETALEQDTASWNQAKIALNQAQIAAETAQSNLEAAKITLRNADAELKRNEGLYAKKFVSKSAVEAAQGAYANAKNQHDQAVKNISSQEEGVKAQREVVESRVKSIDIRRASLLAQKKNLDTLKLSRASAEKQAEVQLETSQTRLKQTLGSIDAEKENSKSSLAVAYANYLRAESALKNAEERLAWTRITAPMSGVVTQLVAEEGEIVQSGRSAFSSGPAIMTIADLSQMVVKVYINEVDIPKISVGQPVEIRADAYADKIFKGSVKEISPQALPRDNVTKFEVVVAVSGSPMELRPGMNVDVDIIVADRPGVIQLPIDTLIEKTKLTVEVAVPAKEVGSLKRNQLVEVETRAGKRYPSRVVKLDGANGYPVVLFVNEDAPPGLRAGELTVALVLKKEDEKADDRKIENVSAKVKSERKQLTLLPDANAEPKKPGFFDRFMFFKPGNGKEKNRPRGIETEIKVGLRNDTSYELLGGLKVGDEVLIPELREIVSPNTSQGR